MYWGRVTIGARAGLLLDLSLGLCRRYVGGCKACCELLFGQEVRKGTVLLADVENALMRFGGRQAGGDEVLWDDSAKAMRAFHIDD